MRLILFFLLGASLGSFLGLVVDRYPEKSIISPRSQCNNCQHQLALRDLIPIASAIINKGRCRFCNYPIPLKYSLLELICGGIGLAFALHFLTGTQIFLLAMGLLLSLYDCKEQNYPLILWLGFTLILILFYPLNLISIILLLFGILAALKNINIGSGDFLYLASLALSLDFQALLWIIQIASLTGIGYCLFWHKQGEPLAFIPFLFLGYCIVIWLT